MNLRILAPLVLATSALLVAQAPRPTPEHQRLAFWVGQWKGEWVARENPFGFPLGAYSDLDILGYDTDRGRQVLFALDSFGTASRPRKPHLGSARCRTSSPGTARTGQPSAKAG